MARSARTGGGRTITKPLGKRTVDTGGKFSRPSNSSDTEIVIKSNRAAGPRLNPKG